MVKKESNILGNVESVKLDLNPNFFSTQTLEDEKKNIKRRGKPGRKGYKIQDNATEVSLVVKIPTNLRDTLHDKAEMYNISLKEFVTKSLTNTVSFSVEKEPKSIAEALSIVSAKGYKFCNLPSELQTELTLQAAIVSDPDSIGTILKHCPESLISSITKEQWLSGIEQDMNVMKRVPESIKKQLKKEINSLIYK